MKQVAVIAAALSTDARQAAALARSNGFAGLVFDAYSPALSIPDLSQTGRREFRFARLAHDFARPRSAPIHSYKMKAGGPRTRVVGLLAANYLSRQEALRV